MGNQQLRLFTEEQLQLFLTSRLGDGCLFSSKNSPYYITNCKYEEYINFKMNLLGDLFKNKRLVENNGFAKMPIWEMRSKSYKPLLDIKNMPISEIIDNLNELGIALWFYDDGSLHQRKLFYNLNTHKFDKSTQENIFIPFFNRIGIFPKLRIENKKDGRTFYYLSIGKYDGAYKISKILSKYPINCYFYKRWSSETIHKWSKLQEKLKSTDKIFSTRALGHLWESL